MPSKGHAKKNEHGHSNAREKDKKGYLYVGRLHKTILYNQLWCNYITGLQRSYFKLMTGTDLRLQLTPETQPYATTWESRRNIDRLLRTEFAQRPVIFEPMCGSGCDIIWSLMDLDPAQIFGVDMMKAEEFEKTRQNIINFYSQFPNDYIDETVNEIDSRTKKGQWEGRVCLHRKFSWQFIKEYADEMDRTKRPKRFDLVLIDAPWDTKLLSSLNEIQQSQALMAEADRRNAFVLPKDDSEFVRHRDYETKEVPPELFFQHIVACVLKPMRDRGVECGVVCLKVRWEMSPTLMQQYLGTNAFMNEHFDVQYSVQVLPNVRNANKTFDSKTGKWYITDYHGVRQVTDAHTNQKGEYYFVTFKPKDYLLFPDVRSDWYDHMVLSGDPVKSSLYVDRNTWLTPTKSSYSKNMPDPTILDQVQHTRAEQLHMDLTSYEEVRKGQTRGSTIIIDLETYIKELRDYIKLCSGPRPDLQKNAKKIYSTIDHVKRFYIEKEHEHVNSQGTQSQRIKSLIATLKEVIEETKQVISPDTVALPKTEEAYRQYFEDIRLRLEGSETNVPRTAKGKGDTTMKKRLLDLTPELEKIIQKYRDNKEDASAKTLLPTIDRLIQKLNIAQRTEIEGYIAEFSAFRKNPWPYEPKFKRQKELHEKIGNCVSWYVMQVNGNVNFEAETRTLISKLSSEIELLQTQEIQEYVNKLAVIRSKSTNWGEMMDKEQEINDTIEYCRVWYVNNDDFSLFEEQNADRMQIAALQEEITKVEAYMAEVNASMSTPTGPGKTGGKGKKGRGFKAHMPLESEHVEMSTLLTLLREVCVRFDT
jgi:hypothetical protein